MALLVLLMVVLPLQGAVQMISGLHGQRHMHAVLAEPLRALLAQLHAAQAAPSLQARAPGWTVSTGLAHRHAHGGVFHEHAPDDGDVIQVGDTADEAVQGGATAFLAWLPAGLRLPASGSFRRPAAAVHAWRDRAIAPPLAPPRG